MILQISLTFIVLLKTKHEQVFIKFEKNNDGSVMMVVTLTTLRTIIYHIRLKRQIAVLKTTTTINPSRTQNKKKRISFKKLFILFSLHINNSFSL